MAQAKSAPLIKSGGEPGSEVRETGSEGDTLQFPVSSLRLTVWLLLATLTMMFGALIAAYLMRLPSKSQFPFQPPDILWFNTFVLLLSSGSCQWALRSIRHDSKRGLVLGLWITLVLGFLFLVGQLYGWYQLVQAGVYAQNNVFSSLFYLMTAAHGIHLLIGLGLLVYVWSRALMQRYTAGQHLSIELTTIYWHYLDFVWLCMFVLLMFL